MILLRCIFLHCFFQRHVSTLAMTHLQIDYFFLVRQNIQLAMLLLLLAMKSRVTYKKKLKIS